MNSQFFLPSKTNKTSTHIKQHINMEVTQVQIDTQEVQIDTQEFDAQDQIDTHQDQDAQDAFCDEVDKESQDLLDGLDNLKDGSGSDSVKTMVKRTKFSPVVTGDGDVQDLLSQLALQTTLSITNLNRQTEQFSKMIMAFGNRLDSNIQEMKNDVNAVNGKIDSAVLKVDEKIEKKFEQLREQHETLKKESQCKVSENSLFSSDVGRTLWPCMPILFDTMKGLYGWFPVHFTDTDNEEHDVVVISVPMVIFLLQTFDGKITNSLQKRATENHLRSLDRFQLIASERIENFTRIMKKTPFKCYSIFTGNSAKKRPISFKNNVDNYIIVDTSYWKNLMGSVKETFPNRPLEVPCLTKGLHRNTMFSTASLIAFSKSDDRTDKLRPFGDVQFSFEDRVTWPSMGVPIWKEANNSAIKNFFSIDESCNRHIIDGQYNPCTDECITFEETLDRIEDEDKYAHEEDGEEAEESNDGSKKRPRDEDWSSEYN